MIIAASLAGLVLGQPIKDYVPSQALETRVPGGWRWHWAPESGGSLTVLTDGKGRIVMIDYVISTGMRGHVDLPCAPAFDLEGSHLNLSFAAEKVGCAAHDFGEYELPDHSILDVDFGQPDGPLKEAIWASKAWATSGE